MRAQRRLCKPIIKKDVITVDMISKLYDQDYNVENLYSQRIIVISLLCYSGFMRSAEVLRLTRSDIRIHATHMLIFIEHSKTDIYRDGAWLVIARVDGKLCPVENLLLYLRLAGIQVDSSEYIFRNVTKTKSGYVLRNENKPIVYTRLRELFKGYFQSVVPDVSRIGLHSLRAGGATAGQIAGFQIGYLKDMAAGVLRPLKMDTSRTISKCFYLFRRIWVYIETFYRYI